MDTDFETYVDARTYAPEFIAAVRESLYELAETYAVTVQQVG